MPEPSWVSELTAVPVPHLCTGQGTSTLPNPEEALLLAAGQLNTPEANKIERGACCPRGEIWSYFHKGREACGWRGEKDPCGHAF